MDADPAATPAPVLPSVLAVPDLLGSLASLLGAQDMRELARASPQTHACLEAPTHDLPVTLGAAFSNPRCRALAKECATGASYHQRVCTLRGVLQCPQDRFGVAQLAPSFDTKSTAAEPLALLAVRSMGLPEFMCGHAACYVEWTLNQRDSCTCGGGAIPLPRAALLPIIVNGVLMPPSRHATTQLLHIARDASMFLMAPGVDELDALDAIHSGASLTERVLITMLDTTTPVATPAKLVFFARASAAAAALWHMLIAHALRHGSLASVALRALFVRAQRQTFPVLAEVADADWEQAESEYELPRPRVTVLMPGQRAVEPTGRLAFQMRGVVRTEAGELFGTSADAEVAALEIAIVEMAVSCARSAVSRLRYLADLRLDKEKEADVRALLDVNASHFALIPPRGVDGTFEVRVTYTGGMEDARFFGPATSHAPRLTEVLAADLAVVVARVQGAIVAVDDFRHTQVPREAARQYTAAIAALGEMQRRMAKRLPALTSMCGLSPCAGADEFHQEVERLAPELRGLRGVAGGAERPPFVHTPTIRSVPGGRAFVELPVRSLGTVAVLTHADVEDAADFAAGRQTEVEGYSGMRRKRAVEAYQAEEERFFGRRRARTVAAYRRPRVEEAEVVDMSADTTDAEDDYDPAERAGSPEV